MRRSTKIALVISGLVLICLVGTCVAAVSLGPSLPTLFGCRDTTVPSVGPVRDTATRVRQMYPKLANVTAAHWQEREMRPRTCPEIGPMDYETTGFVALAADQAASYRAAFTWTSASDPDVRPDLRPYAPPAPKWETSNEFVRNVADTNSTFVFDAASATLYFAHVTS